MNREQNKKVKKARCIRDLKLLAWKVEDIQDKILYYTLDFPQEWYEKLFSWYQMILNRTQVTLPLKSLNAALQALPISLIDIKSKIWRDHYEWLIFSEPIDEKIVFEVFQSWFTVQFVNYERIDNDLKNKIIEEFNGFSREQLKLNKQELDLSIYKQRENGTVDIPGISYSLLPSYIMSYIANKRIPIEISGKEYYFYMTYNANSKAELISYPIESGNGKYYSVGIMLKLVNLPGIKEPVVKLITKTKRWANGKYGETISRSSGTTVFIKYNDNRLSLHEQGTTLGIEKIKYSYGENRFIWDLKTKEILENAKLAYLPDIQEILEESEQHLNEKELYSLWITYNKDNKFDHSIKTGMTMHEKNDIFKQVTEYFSFLRPIEKEALSRITNCRLRYNLLGNNKEKKLINYLEVTSRHYNEINIEILWQRESTPQMIIKWFKERLKENEGITWDDENISFKFNNLTVNLIPIYSSDLVAPIEEYKQKVESVKEYISDKKQYVLSIVEILPKDHKSYRSGKDPKTAIRRGLFQCNRINQFVNMQEELNEHKIENTVGELFRQLGVCIATPKTKGLKGIPEDLDIVGFLLLGGNKGDNKDAVEMPIAIATSTYDETILVKTPLSDEWLDYYEAILELGKREYKLYEKKPKDRKVSVQQVSTFYQQVLYDMQDKDAVVIVDVSNRMDSLLPDFQNQNLSINDTNREHKKVRIIRVKSNDEIPDYVGEGRENKIEDFLSGVWKITEDIYYSLERKGVTYQNINSSRAKVDYPYEFVKYPKILEIIPVKLLDEDNKESYVYFTHALRLMNSMYKDFTKKPFIIHLGEKLQEVLEIKD